MKTVVTVFTIFLVLSNLSNLVGIEKNNKIQKITIQQAQKDSTRKVTLNKKSPKGAMIRSLVFPGWGQWYNEQKIKAVLVFSLESFLLRLSVYYPHKAANSVSGSQAELFYKDKRNLTYLWIGGFTLLSMLDAYIDAHLYDFDSGPDLDLRIGVLNESITEKGKRKYLGFSLRATF